MAHKLLSFTILISFMTLAAAGSRSAVPTPLQALATGSDEYVCVYTIYVETGSIADAGTDAVIALMLTAADGRGFTLTDLARSWGLMDDDHDYYEPGNVDIFGGRSFCLPSPPCRITLTSDGSGEHHGWYCKSVEVTTTGQHAGCTKAEFSVEQWLATDVPPYQLYAERSICTQSNAERRKNGDAEE